MASLFRARVAGAAFVDHASDPWDRYGGYSGEKDKKPRARISVRKLQLIAVASLAVALVGAWIYCQNLYDYYHEHPIIYSFSSNTDDQPLYTIKKNFFPKDVFEGMQDRLVDGDLARVPNTLDADNFGQTSGIVIMFNLKGLKRFREDPDFKDMAMFLDAVMVKGANVFAVNLLQVKSAPERVGNQKQRAAAGFHVDDTINLNEPFWRRTSVHSHVTSVIYLNIPKDMEGGHFVMRPEDVPGHKHDKETVITPEENMMMTFRGDAGHEVQPFRSRSYDVRCSFVVEQYILPPDLYRYAPEWSSSMDPY